MGLLYDYQECYGFLFKIGTPIPSSGLAMGIKNDALIYKPR